jgi:hypothetical protein
VDNCPIGNNLKNAQIKFAGTVAGKEIDEEVPVAEAPSTPKIRYVDHDAKMGAPPAKAGPMPF